MVDIDFLGVKEITEICTEHFGTCTNTGKMALLEASEKIDHLFLLKEGAFGFLTEQKDSPYPWMMAACALSGALPHFLLFMSVIWLDS
jgi:hypothetical protein